ncbi:phosphatase 2C-like domain-containing protein [Cladochytrium replicatum]|nr:phosphatase 2C-like domain-containing protein [Cladochytrium replicatum]
MTPRSVLTAGLFKGSTLGHAEIPAATAANVLVIALTPHNSKMRSRSFCANVNTTSPHVRIKHPKLPAPTTIQPHSRISKVHANSSISAIDAISSRHSSTYASARNGTAPKAPWLGSTNSLFELFEKTIPRPRRNFRFNFGASGVPKNGSLAVSDSKYLSVQVGEDAYFTRPDALGVADGVGGWAGTKGANPALFSRLLMHHAKAEVEKYDDLANYEEEVRDYYAIDPRTVMRRSYEQVMKNKSLVGSSTALIVILRNDELRVANLGDCGMMVIRDDEIIFRTEEQQHMFNFPYQLGTGSHDGPQDAQVFRVKVQESDLVIIGSDGMFDNVFDDEILDLVGRVTDGDPISKVDPQRITEALAKRAVEVAEDPRCISSPFQTRAIDEGVYYQGGKMDDVTVLTAVVGIAEDSPDRR